MRPWLLVLGCIFTLIGCTPTLPPFGEQRRCASGDWVNFVTFNDIQYVESRSGVGRAITEDDLGAEFARVQFRADGNVCGLDYRPQNGHAAYLDRGTQVFSVKGHLPSFWLAARLDHRWVLYEADSNPHARRGSDLIDLARVQRIGINSKRDGTTELAAIDDPQQVAQLVAMIERAPVDQTSNHPAMYFIAFYFTDGTATTRAFDLNSGELWRGIQLPAEFGQAVQQAVAAKGRSTQEPAQEHPLPVAR